MKKYLTLCLSALCPLILSAQSDTVQPENHAETVISRHIVRFTAPPKRIPAPYSTDAPLLGNGFTGVALSGAPEAQVFYVARNDFWRLKSALDESFPLLLGKLHVNMPQLKGATYSVEQNLYEAVTTLRFAKEGYTVACKAFVAATTDVMIMELSMEGEGQIKGSAYLSFISEQEQINQPPRERVFPDVRTHEKTTDGVESLSRAFVESVDIPTQGAIALRVIGSNDGTFTLEPGKTVRLVCAFSSNFKSDDCMSTVTKSVKRLTDKRQAKVERRHKEWWRTYWDKSFVSIPDSTVEKQYYLSLYGMGSCSRDEKFPPSIFGTWITKERPWWNGDYHLNYNHMAPYYALFSANRIEQAMPYHMSMLDQIPRGNYYSQKVTGIPDGILLPVGAGPLGVETTRMNEFGFTYSKNWVKHGNVEDEGVFWGQKSNSAYAVTNMAMQFYRTWDKDFARKIYPFVKGVATFWEKYLKREGNRYVIYNDAIHEGTVGTKNPILSLGLVRMVLQTVCDMSAFLDVDEEKRPQWQFIREHLSDYPQQKRDGKTVFRYTEKGCDWWNGNTLGIQHIYPAGQIGLNSDPQLLAVARNTIDVMQRWSDFNGTNSFFPAAVRVGYAPDVILPNLERYSRHTYPNGFQAGNPHGIENWSTVPNTINEMLCMGHQDIVRVFPVWPRDKDASFHQIRVEGAFLVSSELKGGTVTHVTLISEKGRPLALQNPWPDKQVDIIDNGSFKGTVQGAVINMKTKAGHRYDFILNKYKN